MEENQVQPNTITYWESRQINIGDYENISFGATYGMKIIEINRKDKKVEINHKHSQEVYPQMTKDEALEKAVEAVHKILNAREKDIRLRSQINGGTTFGTAAKGVDFGVIKPEDLQASTGITKVEDDEVAAPAKAKSVFKDEDFDDLFDDEEFDAPKKTAAKKGKNRFVLVGGKTSVPKRGKNVDTDFDDENGPPKLDLDEEIPF